ncbi:hypothetical protein [Nocardia sp. CS682]|uniref:hypothetical protein n=1 Tax=Nocardia sp. CS682 TaxID=1047172 RepID=UPI00107579BD|nr:hypothetical protein [Nocardia sp. CS682]
METPTGATITVADLETADILDGAQVRAGTLDGLYLYTAQERRHNFEAETRRSPLSSGRVGTAVGCGHQLVMY